MSVSKELGVERQIEFPGGTVTYRERGTGEPLVFVHGLLVNGDLWRRIVPELSKTFRCITPDWPLGSHSLPMNPDADLSPPGLARLIADFLAALDLRNVTLIGNDTGGALCQLVVTEHPERIGRLVLTPCDAFEIFPPTMFKYLGIVARIPGGVFVLTQGMRLRAMRRLPLAFGWLTKRPLPDEITDSFVRPAIGSSSIRRDTIRVIQGLSPKYTIAATRKLGQFDKPVLLAWAGDDRFFPMELGRRLEAVFPNVRFEVVGGARTFVSEDQPEQLAKLIHGFAHKPAGSAAQAQA